MMRLRTIGLAPFPLLLLAGCGAADNDPGVGAVTAGEARALNDAAAMLDRNMPPPTAMPPGRSPGTLPDNAAVPADGEQMLVNRR